ncbi:MAG: signal peptidase I [Rickettsiales bacterium]
MTNATETNAGTAPSDKKKSWDEPLKSIIYAVLLALVFRSLLFEPFHIPSSSMKDTLLIGDYIFVSKYSYGYGRYSFPLGLVPFKGRIFGSTPERGDVVVFRKPNQPSIDFIKRLIGLPGDTIQVKQGVLFVNGKEVPRRAISDYKNEEAGAVTSMRRYVETLPNGKSYHVLDMTQFGAVDNTGVYTVPDHHYFMMGDNRDNSTDSRYLDEVGFVPEENLVGRATIIFFSLKDDVHFWEFWKWPTAFRTHRLLRSID